MKSPDAGSPAAVLIICGLLVAAVAVIYGQTWNHGFVNLDDNVCISENPWIHKGLTLKSLGWAFTNRTGGNWSPITWISHQLDWRIWGNWAGGHHLTNLLLHAGTAVGLFLALRRMTGRLWSSALAAAIWTVHPMRVESVAWVTERKDVLSGLFFVLTIGAYARYAMPSSLRPLASGDSGFGDSGIRGYDEVRQTLDSQPSTLNSRLSTLNSQLSPLPSPLSSLPFYLAMLAMALGLMSKPMLVTLPGVLLLLDYWPLCRIGKERPARDVLLLAVEKLSFVALAAGSCAATYWAELVELHEPLPWSWRIGNAILSYAGYLGQFFWPANLAPLQPRRPLELPWIEVAAAAALLTCITAAAIVVRRRMPYLPVGWFWHLGMLLPVIGLVSFGTLAPADRFTYLPQIGLCLALAFAAAGVVRHWPRCRGVVVLVALAAIIALTCCAWRQTAYWRDSLTLWPRTLATTEGNFTAHRTYGLALADAGCVNEAVEQFQRAVDINPRYAEAHFSLGVAEAGRGQVGKALAHYRRAVAANPNYVPARNNLGNLLVKLGREDEALEHLLAAVKLDPNLPEAHWNLGNVWFFQGRFQAAAEEYRLALACKPDYADAHFNLALALAELGQMEEARRHYRRAVELNPALPQIRGHKGL